MPLIVVLMLGQRRGRWPSIKIKLVQCTVFVLHPPVVVCKDASRRYDQL